MKKRLAALAIVGGLVLGVGGTAFAGPPPPPKGCQDTTLPAPKDPNKVSLCHFTGSATNPFIMNEVSVSGAESHLLNPDHHGDCGLYGTGDKIPDALKGVEVCVQ